MNVFTLVALHDELTKIAKSAMPEGDIHAFSQEERAKHIEEYANKHAPPRKDSVVTKRARPLKPTAAEAAPTMVRKAEGGVKPGAIRKAGASAASFVKHRPGLALGAVGGVGLLAGAGAMALHRRRRAAAMAAPAAPTPEA